MTAAVGFANVSASYGAREVLSGVTSAFAAGAVTGIVGPNGAGKTTLFRTALGLMPTTGGAIHVLDKPLPQWSRDGLARALAYLPQGSDAHWPVKARQLVSLGRLPHRAAFAALGLMPTTGGVIHVLDKSLPQWSRDGLSRALAYLPQGSDAHWPVKARQLVSLGRLPHRAAFAALAPADAIAIDEALERCDAQQFAERRMDELSAGERARVLFARALATSAPVLLADEPAAYLDPSHQLRLMELLREEAARGTAVAVTLHDLALASRHCDELIVLDRGQVAGQGVPPAALSDTLLARVFGIAALHVPDPSGGPAAVTPWRRL